MSISVLLAFVFLLGLGSWQLQRLFWKEELIARFATNIARQPVPWRVFAPQRAADTENLQEFRRTELRGEYLHEHEMYLTSRSRAGEPGLAVLTPMRLSSGEIVLINRGWIESDFRDPSTREDGMFAGEVTIVGLYRLARPASGIRAAVLPENDPVKNTWYTLDLPAMAEHTALSMEQEYYFLDAREGEPMPYGRQWNFRLINNHLQYAITWYALGAVLLVMYGIFGWKRARELDG